MLPRASFPKTFPEVLCKERTKNRRNRILDAATNRPIQGNRRLATVSSRESHPAKVDVGQGEIRPHDVDGLLSRVNCGGVRIPQKPLDFRIVEHLVICRCKLDVVDSAVIKLRALWLELAAGLVGHLARTGDRINHLVHRDLKPTIRSC